jgi:hypothetical protein
MKLEEIYEYLEYVYNSMVETKRIRKQDELYTRWLVEISEKIRDEYNNIKNKRIKH